MTCADGVGGTAEGVGGVMYVSHPVPVQHAVMMFDIVVSYMSMSAVDALTAATEKVHNFCTYQSQYVI